MGLVCGLVTVGIGVDQKALAGTTKVWRLGTTEEFQEGTLGGVTLTSTGELLPGAELVRTESPDPVVWSIVEGKDGALYAGTGNRGIIYRVREGVAEPLFETGELLVSCLLAGSDGNLYAGTIPQGKIFRVSLEGKAELLCQLEAPYVWCLAEGTSAEFYAGTGPNGKIFRVSQEGRAEPLASTRDEHVLSIVSLSEGGVLCGTSPNGLVHRVLPSGSLVTLLDLEENEVRSLSRAGSKVYLAANKAKKFTPERFVRKLKQVIEKQEDEEEESDGSSGRQKESPLGHLFEGSIYELDLEGGHRQIFSLSKGYFTDVAARGSQGVYASSGPLGRVFFVSSDRTVDLACDLREREALCLAVKKGKIRGIGASPGGAVYRVKPKRSTPSWYLSAIHDAKFRSFWGKMEWAGSDRLRVETRSGNTAVPDETWSLWSKPCETSPSSVASSPARYLQVRMVWPVKSKAVLQWLTVAYHTDNQQPRVLSIELENYTPRQGYLGKQKASAEMKLQWKADDPDGDELVYYLTSRRTPGLDWMPLAEGKPLREGKFSWDTSTVEDGWYELKVEASDELVNPAESVLRAWWKTPALLIDNRKPEVSSLEVSPELLCNAVAEDSFSDISRAEFSIDSGPWIFIGTADGIYDGRREDFTFQIPPCATGRHWVALRVFDAAGNTAVRQQVFESK